LKITVLGKGMVGKSSLSYSFINYDSPEAHDPTIEDKYKVQLMIDNVSCEIEILDTAGQDDYQNLIDGWINFGDGFLLVFALNDKESWDFLVSRRDRILKMKKGENPPIVVVGNKSDLERQRVFKSEEIRKYTSEWGCEYIETSATTKYNCKECFQLLARDILKKKNPIKQSKCPCSIL